MKTLNALMLAAIVAGSVAMVVRAEDTTGEKVEKSAYKAKRKVKHHVRKAKTDIKNSADDNPIRKGARRAEDAGNDALDKVEDTVHGH